VNARAYTLQACFALLLIVIVNRWKEEPVSFAPRLYYGAVAALSLYLLPTSVYLLVLSGCLFFLPLPRTARELGARIKDFLPPALAGIVVAVLLYSPAIIYSGPSAIIANRFVQTVSDPFLELVRSVAEAGFVTVLGWPWLLIAAVAAGFIAAMAIPAARSLAVGMVAVFAVAVVQGGDPPSRIWTFLMPVILLTAGAGIVWILRLPQLSYAAGASIAVFGAVSVLAPAAMTGLDRMLFNTPDVQAMAEVLKPLVSKNTIVFVDNRYGPSMHYYMKRLNARPEIFNVESGRTPDTLFVVCDQPVCTWYAQTEIVKGASLWGLADARVNHGLELGDRRYPALAARWNGGRIPDLSMSNRVWGNSHAAIHAIPIK
jgi:hypothetical protein